MTRPVDAAVEVAREWRAWQEWLALPANVRRALPEADIPDPPETGKESAVLLLARFVETWAPVIEAAVRWRTERGPKQSGALTEVLEQALDTLAAAREVG